MEGIVDYAEIDDDEMMIMMESIVSSCLYVPVC